MAKFSSWTVYILLEMRAVCMTNGTLKSATKRRLSSKQASCAEARVSLMRFRERSPGWRMCHISHSWGPCSLPYSTYERLPTAQGKGGKWAPGLEIHSSSK
jgi:hypothetical protein